MEKVKKVLSICFDKVVPSIIAVGGPFIAAYIIGFQTVGFQYASMMSCLFAILIGCIIGFSSLRYLKNQKVKDQKSLFSMVRSYDFCFILLMIAAAVASEVSFFLVGIGGGAMCWSALTFFVVWKRSELFVKAE